MLMKPLPKHTDSVPKSSKNEIERTYEQPLPQVQDAPHLQLELPQPDMVNDEERARTRAGKQKVSKSLWARVLRQGEVGRIRQC